MGSPFPPPGVNSTRERFFKSLDEVRQVLDVKRVPQDLDISTVKAVFPIRTAAYITPYVRNVNDASAIAAAGSDAWLARETCPEDIEGVARVLLGAELLLTATNGTDTVDIDIYRNLFGPQYAIGAATPDDMFITRLSGLTRDDDVYAGNAIWNGLIGSVWPPYNTLRFFAAAAGGNAGAFTVAWRIHWGIIE